MENCCITEGKPTVTLKAEAPQIRYISLSAQTKRSLTENMMNVLSHSLNTPCNRIGKFATSTNSFSFPIFSHITLWAHVSQLGS